MLSASIIAGLALWTAAVAVIAYRIGRGTGYDAGVRDAGRMIYPDLEPPG